MTLIQSLLRQCAAVIGLACTPIVALAGAGTLQFSAATQSAEEDDGQVTVTVTRANGADGYVTVRYSVAGGTAKTASGDMTSDSGVLAWTDQDAAPKTFVVTLLDDSTAEASEQFYVRLGSPTGGFAQGGVKLGSPAEQTVTIFDDDGAGAPGAIQFNGAAQSVSESAGTVVAKVSRYGGANGVASVRYSVAGGTAKTADGDMSSDAGVLTWADQDGADKNITVTLLNDSAIEPSEQFAIRLATPAGVGVTLGSPTEQIVTVLDDDSDFLFSGSGSPCPIPDGTTLFTRWSGQLGVNAFGNLQGSDQEARSFALPSGCTIRSMKLDLTWDRPTEDLDLNVTMPGGQTLVSENFQTSGKGLESITVSSPASGSYTTTAKGFISANTAFKVSATVVVGAGGGVSTSTSRVVVADLDTGINPYHDFYYEGSPIYPSGSPPKAVTAQVLSDFGINPLTHVLTLTRTGNFAADYAADVALGKWNVNPGELYHIKDTNLIVASFDTAAGRKRILPDEGDASGEHGVGTSAAVLAANPEAILMFVETGTDIGNAAGSTLGFRHPLVDIVTTSYGYAVPVVGVGLPIPFLLSPDSFAAVVNEGKLHFSSAANSPDPFTPESGGGAGPWWSIGVGGWEEGSSEGRTTLAGFFTDFVGDWTQRLPYCYTCESDYNDNVGGTSFATPRSAGVASKVLLEARRALAHDGNIKTVAGKKVLVSDGAGRTISNWQLRRALEEGAYYNAFADYDPVQGVIDFGATPPVDAAPYLTQGWGELSATETKAVVEETLAQLGFGTPTRSKSQEACDFQAANMYRRQLYWNNVGWFFNTFDVPAEDPYLYCGTRLP